MITYDLEYYRDAADRYGALLTCLILRLGGTVEITLEEWRDLPAYCMIESEDLLNGSWRYTVVEANEEKVAEREEQEAGK